MSSHPEWFHSVHLPLRSAMKPHFPNYIRFLPLKHIIITQSLANPLLSQNVTFIKAVIQEPTITIHQEVCLCIGTETRLDFLLITITKLDCLNLGRGSRKILNSRESAWHTKHEDITIITLDKVLWAMKF